MSIAAKPKKEWCLRSVRDLPPESYELWFDGRERRSLGTKRRQLAMQLATYANGDGTGIRVATATLARQLGVGRTTIHRLLDDLVDLGILCNHGLTGFKGTRIRTLNLARLRELAQVSNSGSTDVSNSVAQVSNSGCTNFKLADADVSNSRIDPPEIREFETEPPTSPTSTNKPLLPNLTQPGRGLDQDRVPASTEDEEATKEQKKQLRERWNALVEKLDPETGLVSNDGTNAIYLRGVQPTFKQREEIFKQVDLIGAEPWRMAVEAWARADKIYGLDCPWWAWLERGKQYFGGILEDALQYRERDVFKMISDKGAKSDECKQIVRSVRQQLFPDNHKLTTMEKLKIWQHIEKNVDLLLKQVMEGNQQ